MPVSLIEAIRSGQEKLAMELLISGQFSDIDYQEHRKDGTALYWAACLNYYELAELLLIEGADPNATTMWQSSPLHAACDNNRIDIVRLLLQANCDINSQTESGDTPCHLAAYRGFSELVQILVENGASLDKVNKKNRNIFTVAQNSANKALTRYLKAVYKLANVSTTPPSKDFSLTCLLRDLDVSSNINNTPSYSRNSEVHSRFQSDCYNCTQDFLGNAYSTTPKNKGLWTNNVVNGNDLSSLTESVSDLKMSYRNL
ncbi:hypothetical protein FSP39_000433 [Pinctada imbricata]|uniref:Uncharacterized protein n=1 Tax=Pinctada imbricata TaxID=66713 RepID=A0AA88YGD8_PINIB|nr:hypothetical protein FSP39_000433 [Pinctada imbricata]